MLHRRRHAGEVPHRSQAHVQVEDLTQRDVEGANASSDRSRQRAFDADEVITEGLDGLLGEPVAGLLERLLAGEHLCPRDLLAVLRRRGVEHELRGGPDVDAGAVAFDERDDRLVGDVERAVGVLRDLVGHAGTLRCALVIVRPVREDEYDAVGDLTVAAYRAIPGAPSVAVDGYEHELRDVRGRVDAGAEVMVAVTAEGALAGGGHLCAATRRTSTPSSTMRTRPGSACSRWRPINRAAERAPRSRSGASTERRATGRKRIIIHSTQWMTTAHRIYERLGFERAEHLDWSPVPGFLLMAFVLEVSS